MDLRITFQFFVRPGARGAIFWMGNEADGWLISTRWSAEGTHSGGSLYRDPTGARCQIWGITQWRVSNGTIEHEWQLFNEFDLMMQIANARRILESGKFDWKYHPHQSPSIHG